MQPIHHRGSPPAAEKEAVDPPQHHHPTLLKENVFVMMTLNTFKYNRLELNLYFLR